MNSTLQRALCAVLPLSMLATAMIWAGGEEEEASAAAGEAAMEGAYQEAPMLAAMVKAGQLPPVDERLPSNPKVVEPYDSIGQYGGTLRMIDVNNSMSIGLRVRHTGLFRYNQTASQSETDLAASHTWSNNNSTLTIELRDGLRWSDGEPFTTADLMFKWEHEILNEEVHPRGIDPFWTIGGKRAVWQAIDDNTLSITWGRPTRWPWIASDAPTFPATTRCSCRPTTSQFHVDFNDDAAALATELGFETWEPLDPAAGCPDMIGTQPTMCAADVPHRVTGPPVPDNEETATSCSSPYLSSSERCSDGPFAAQDTQGIRARRPNDRRVCGRCDLLACLCRVRSQSDRAHRSSWSVSRGQGRGTAQGADCSVSSR